jgi:NADPH-dependent glutamate synthase beta subunit-like oxidoreductase
MEVENDQTVQVLNSVQFLTQICKKQKLCQETELPDFAGKRVVVLGAGNTAIDCCEAAQQLGGQVTLAFRKQTSEIRAAKR